MKSTVFSADKISNNKEKSSQPYFETLILRLAAREYNLGGLVADSRNVTITGKGSVRTLMKLMVFGTVVENKAVFTANETPTEESRLIPFYRL